MQIRIQTSGFDLTPAIAAWVHERLAHRLKRFADKVAAVDVYLRDVNGSKGGRDKEASLRIAGRAGLPMFVESRGHDLYEAIDAVGRRAKRCVRKAHHKRRTYEKVSRLAPQAAFADA